jgi:hypothetical protein
MKIYIYIFKYFNIYFYIFSNNLISFNNSILNIISKNKLFLTINIFSTFFIFKFFLFLFKIIFM